MKTYSTSELRKHVRSLIESLDVDGRGGEAALAQASGVSQSAISKFVNGIQTYSTKLNEFLGVEWSAQHAGYVQVKDAGEVTEKLNTAIGKENVQLKLEIRMLRTQVSMLNAKLASLRARSYGSKDAA